MTIDFTWLEDNLFNTKLSDEQKTRVAPMFEALQFDAKSDIVKQGSMGHALYIVHSGAAKITCNNNGEDIPVATVRTGDLVGEMSFLTAAETSATVTAREACVIYKLTRSSFSQMMQQEQELAYAIFAHLLTHTAGVIRHMNEEKAAVQHYMSGSRF